MGQLLLELLSEEIPARMQVRAAEELARLMREQLAAAEIPAAEIAGYATPRRLTVIAHGIPGTQPERIEERRGPRLGAPSAAIEGFLRAAGLTSLAQCEMRDTGRGEFYFATIRRPGRAAGEVLPALLHAAIVELSWPKSMRFPASSLRWVRPLQSALCLFDGRVLPLPLDGIPVGDTTRGHRFLSPGEIAVTDAANYRRKLEAAYVVLDQRERRERIAAELDRLASGEGLRVKPDPGLLDEVTGLVEFPVVLMGAIDDASMALPPEVLATAMRTHQKYFSCLTEDGRAAPRFLFVANNLTPDDGCTIVAGNERVLRARLADARFFWDQDRKVKLEDRVEALKQRVYYEKLGTMYDKAERIERLSGFLAAKLYSDDPEIGALAKRAALLCKADLSSGMVGEFPELQGVMGRYYALNDDEEGRVADAIADHYKPQGPNDTCPTAPVSIVVALADKFDALAAFFAIDEKPTGSRDPFALRRAALGVIRLIIENDLRISLPEVFFFCGAELLHAPHTAIISHELKQFMFERVRIHLRDAGARHDLVAAAAAGEDDLVRLLRRLRAIESFLKSDDGANLLTAYRRASNIVDIEERKDGVHYDQAVNPSIFSQREERVLDGSLVQAQFVLDVTLHQEQFHEAMTGLAELRAPLDEFFDRVTVNAGDPGLRENRLRLLSRIRAVMNQVADFSQIEG